MRKYYENIMNIIDDIMKVENIHSFQKLLPIRHGVYGLSTI